MLGSLVEVTVASRDVARAVAFARDALDLVAVEEGPAGVVVGVPGLALGRVRFVPASGDPRSPPPVLWEPGPRLLGIYSTDLERTGRQVAASGGTAGPVGVFEIGLETPLRERLVRGPDDLIWTVPDYEPRLPTPALVADPARAHGELHSGVLVVEDLDEALALFARAGGLDVVYDGPFGGDEAERMLDLPRGASLRNAVLGGDRLAPARLELLSFAGVPAERLRRRTVGLRRLTFAADDPERERAALLAGGASELPGGLLAGPVGVELEVRSR